MIKYLSRAAIFGAIAMACAAPAQAYQCKSSSTPAVAIQKFKIAARSKSKSRWSTRVKNQYGLAWSVLKIAQDKSTTCNKVDLNGVKKWKCTTTAKPCLYVVE